MSNECWGSGAGTSCVWMIHKSAVSSSNGFALRWWDLAGHVGERVSKALVEYDFKNSALCVHQQVWLSSKLPLVQGVGRRQFFKKEKALLIVEWEYQTWHIWALSNSGNRDFWTPYRLLETVCIRLVFHHHSELWRTVGFCFLNFFFMQLILQNWENNAVYIEINLYHVQKTGYCWCWNHEAPPKEPLNSIKPACKSNHTADSTLAFPGCVLKSNVFG